MSESTHPNREQRIPVGTKVKWLTHGYGWSKGKNIPGEVLGYSKSGKKVRIKFYLASWVTNEANGMWSVAWVLPRMLEIVQ